MGKDVQTGTVSFINHDKHYIMIEYIVNGRKKVVNGSMVKNNINKKHAFHIGDVVSFTIGLSARGDRMQAGNIRFLYNNALDALINKVKKENNFIGYLKVVDNTYFVKEIDSYLFFPVQLSPWQLKPTEAQLNEAVTFELLHTDNKNKITASLFTTKFIPEYYSAERAYKKQQPVQATVYKISPHGIYLYLFGDKMKAKLSPKAGKLPPQLKTGDSIQVLITYFSKMKIVVEAIL